MFQSTGWALLGLAVLSIALIVPLVIMETIDCSRFNTLFSKKLRQAKNKACIKYLNLYQAKPQWRVAMICSTIIMLFILLVIVIVLHPPIEKLVIIYLLGWLFCNLIIYRKMGMDVWHCLCDSGCVQKPLSTTSYKNMFNVAMIAVIIAIVALFAFSSTIAIKAV